MNQTTRSTRRRTIRVAGHLLAVMAIAVTAACSHPRPPGPRPTTTTTKPGPIMCPLYADGITPIRPCPCPLALDDSAPIRRCPPCPITDAPAGDAASAAIRACPPCPITDAPADGPAIRACPPCPITAVPADDAAIRLCPPPTDPPTGIPGVIAARDFAAFVDAMPGHTPTLIVTGTLVFATGGWKAKIQPASPQGINPKILLMQVVTDPPEGAVTQVLTPVEVRYEVPSSPGAYDSVSVLGLGLNLKVTVAY
jgi:hypothetical protein